MRNQSIIVVALLGGMLAACSREEPPPRSVSDFLENSILLEATMVRCAQDRSQKKYDAECVNAREAANRLAVREEEARRKELEAQFERKRRALRRTQEAVAEARRRADEERRRREEAEYLGIYEPAASDDGAVAALPADSPGTQSQASQGQLPGNQPGVVVEPQSADAATDAPLASGGDINAIREELKRRQDEGN